LDPNFISGPCSEYLVGVWHRLVLASSRATFVEATSFDFLSFPVLDTQYIEEKTFLSLDRLQVLRRNHLLKEQLTAHRENDGIIY
jgi:hypothetical protein